MLQAGGKSKLEKQLKICRLAREMGNANTDSEAFRLAADVCCDVFPGVCSISVALMSKDGVNLHYFKLNNSNNGSHLHMGTLPAAGSASGLAMDLKLPVYTGNFENGGLDFEDWRHVHLRDGALSMISAPLIISDKALGSLNLASSQEHSFDGYEDLTKCLAAILSPYLGLQKFRKELKAVEGVLHQMVPMRVALRLTELQSRVFALSQQSGAAAGVAPYPIHDPGLAPPSDESAAAPDPSEGLVDSGSYTPALRCSGPPGSVGGSSPAGPSSAGWSTAMPPAGAAPVRLRAAGVGAGAAGTSAGAAGAVAAAAGDDVRHRMGALFTFLDPGVERQFTREMYHNWRAHIDVGFLCLTVASLLGMGAASLLEASWSRVLLGLLLLLLLPLLATLLAVVLQPWYQRHREPVLAAARLLRVLVFVVCGAADPVTSCGRLGLFDVAVRSGSVVALVQALTGQVRICWHVPLQWAATTLLILGTVLTDERNPQYVFQAICLQMLLGFCLPTVLLATLEARMRHHFRVKVKTS